MKRPIRWGLGLLLGLEVLFALATAWTASPRTRFAEGFSEAAFRSIQAGESEAEVIRKLGQPLARLPHEGTSGHERVLRYSDQQGPTDNYEAFLVRLNEEGRVRTTEHFLYWD